MYDEEGNITFERVGFGEISVRAPPPPVWLNTYADGLYRADEGEYQEALVLFNKVLVIKPDHLDALLHAARAHKQLGVYYLALDRLYQAMVVRGNQRDIYVTLSEIYRLGGIPDSAAKYQALSRDENW